jgi:hypothetical protein
MAKLNLLPDVAVPVGLGVAEILVTNYDATTASTATKWSPYVGLAAAVLGVIGVMTGKMEPESRALAHAGLPQATAQIWSWIKTALPASTTAYAQPVARPMQSVNRYPAPPLQAPDAFTNVTL